VSTLKRRLEALERRHASAGRCHTCRDWRDCRVVHSDPAMAALADRWAEEYELSQPPERCPECGWKPTTILVNYVEDWRPR
jgi:hypothetical protein